MFATKNDLIWLFVVCLSCLLLSSDVFWKLSLCQVYEESFGCIFTIYASKNEAVCCEVQTHFENVLCLQGLPKNSGCIFMI